MITNNNFNKNYILYCFCTERKRPQKGFGYSQNLPLFLRDSVLAYAKLWCGRTSNQLALHYHNYQSKHSKSWTKGLKKQTDIEMNSNWSSTKQNQKTKQNTEYLFSTPVSIRNSLRYSIKNIFNVFTVKEINAAKICFYLCILLKCKKGNHLLMLAQQRNKKKTEKELGFLIGHKFWG